MIVAEPATHNFGRAVLRAIVHHDDLEIAMIALEDALDSAADHHFLVERRHNDRDMTRIGHCRRCLRPLLASVPHAEAGEEQQPRYTKPDRSNESVIKQTSCPA